MILAMCHYHHDTQRDEYNTQIQSDSKPLIQRTNMCKILLQLHFVKFYYLS